MRLIPDGLLNLIYPREGDQPPPIGRDSDRWGRAKLLAPGDSQSFVQTRQQPIIGAIALQLSFSVDNINYSPLVPPLGSNSVTVKITKSIDLKSDAFIETYVLSPGFGMPFCTLIARGLNVNVSIPNSVALPGLWVHCAACPVETIDCDSIISPAASSWTDQNTLQVASNTVIPFVAMPANPNRKQAFIQNNSAAPLYLGFGSFIPSAGTPPASNLIIPGSLPNGVWESFPLAFTGVVNAVFGPGGSATTYATFTQGI